jgi:hypothetical protein
LERKSALQSPYEIEGSILCWLTTSRRSFACALRSCEHGGRVRDTPLEVGPAAAAGRTFLSPAITTFFFAQTSDRRAPA